MVAKNFICEPCVVERLLAALDRERAEVKRLTEAHSSEMAIRELNRMLRFCGERPGGAVMSQRMEGAADARHAIRKEIRERIRLLSHSYEHTP